MSTDAPTPPRGQPPNLSRVQVYLYALLALFCGAAFAGTVRSVAESAADDQVLLLLVAAGVLLGGGLALAAVALVMRGIRGLPAERRYRLSRLHTVALTGLVVAFLTVVSLRPSMLAPTPAPPAGGLLLPTNLAAALPLAAAATALVVLGAAYRRLNPPE